MAETKVSKTKETKEIKKEIKKEEKPEVKKPEEKKTHDKKKKRAVPQGQAFVLASFNNTIITITDPEGAVIATASAGAAGFKGTKKSTAFAATRAAQDVVTKSQKYGVKEVKVYVKGPGPGRNAAVKGLEAYGLRISFLADITTLPHNGCRPRRKPRK
jgi:small subunit ribosomal protein S11